MSRLQGKRTLITGGTTGIGLATAKEFLAEGARVIITGQNPQTLAAAQRDLGSEAQVIASNAGDAAGQKALAEQVKSRLGGLDAVFINAGVGDFRPIEAFDEAAFDATMAVNVKGPYFLIQALLPLLSNPSSIVFNASINAYLGMPNSSIYAASKAALISMARTFSGELVDRGIRVNVISPGPVTTPIYKKLGLNADQLQGFQQYVKGLVRMKRFGEPVEIAKAAVFLASDESSFMIGGEMVIDGGMATL